MRAIDAKKLTEDLGREDWPSPFATDERAPGWVTTGHFAVYVGPEAAKGFPGKVPYDRFVGDRSPLGKALDGIRAGMGNAAQVTEDPRFHIPVSEDDPGQCVYFRGARQVCIQGRYAPLLEGLKVVHAGDEGDPLLGLDPDGDLVAVVLPFTPGTRGPRKPIKRFRRLHPPVARKEP